MLPKFQENHKYNIMKSQDRKMNNVFAYYEGWQGLQDRMFQKGFMDKLLHAINFAFQEGLTILFLSWFIATSYNIYTLYPWIYT